MKIVESLNILEQIGYMSKNEDSVLHKIVYGHDMLRTAIISILNYGTHRERHYNGGNHNIRSEL